MSATIATLAEVLEAVETDLPDGVLQRYINDAEAAVRKQLTVKERATLPVIVWAKRYSPALGSSADLTLPSSILAYPWVRFEGTVEYDSGTPLFTADTEELDEDGGSDTITPVTADGIFITDGAVVATIDSTGKELTLDATATTAALTFTRILGLQEQEHPVDYVSAVLDLVELAVLNRGFDTERVGQYSVQMRDYQTEKWAILRRVVFSGSESVAY